MLMARSGLLLVILILAGYIKARLLDFPLERDEGAFSYMAKLILDGKSLYTDGYDFKPPGLYLTYALFMKLFGETASGIRTGLLIFNTLSILLFYQISKSFFRHSAALGATLAFATFSVSPAFLAHAAHATQFIILPLLAGLWSLLSFFKKPSRKLCLLSGFCMGITFLMKQPALMFGIFGGVCYLFSGYFSGEKKKWLTVSYASLYTAGLVAPLLALMLWLTRLTPLSQYWFWNFQYPGQYGTVLGLGEGWSNFKIMFPNVVGNFKGLWFICFTGFLLLPFYKMDKRSALVAGLLTLFSMAAVAPGLYFRKHYFIVMIPALALLSGVSLDFFTRFLARNRVALSHIPTLVFTLVIMASLYSERGYFFTRDPLALSQEIYGLNPFAASIKVGEYIRDHTKREDKIFVFGSEPQIYLYAERRAVSPIIFTYPLVENNPFAKELQQRLITDLKKEIPEYLVYVNLPYSWSAHPEHDRRIFVWITDFLAEKFQMEGYVDLISEERTEYVWGKENVVKPPVSENSILIFRKRG